MRKIMMAAVAAAGLIGTSAIAQTTGGVGASASGAQGSVAGGATLGTNDARSQPGQRGRMNREQRRTERRQEMNSSSTYGSGTVRTTRGSATGGVTAGGSATGTGPTSSSTAIDAYGSTTRQGSDAEVYGDSTANAGRPPR